MLAGTICARFSPLQEPQVGARMVVAAGKGKKGRKKNKGKKKAASADTSFSEVPRIGLEATTTSIRRQIDSIREIELKKKQSQQPQRRLSNPKRRLADKQARQSQQTAKEREQEQDLLEHTSHLRNIRKHRHSIQTVYNTLGHPNAPVVIVDGYNVLYLISRIRAYRKRGGKRKQAQDAASSKLASRHAEAGLVFSSPGGCTTDGMSSEQLSKMREEVQRSVVQYADSKGFKAHIVWDAMGRTGESAHVSTEIFDSLCIAYTAGMEADSHLSDAARAYLEGGARFVQVVTSDREAGTILLNNVVVCSAESFTEEMERVTRDEDESVNSVSNRFFLGGSILLSPEIQQKLSRHIADRDSSSSSGSE